MKDHRLIQFARQMRHEPTDAERRIWWYLRNQKLEGMHFRRQHTVGSYIVDFYCPAAHLAVELDGGQHSQAAAYDEQRTRAMAAQGIEVIRFSDYDALANSEAVALTILREARRRMGR